MRSVEAKRGRLLLVESVAGWVFADLLLVLFLVGLGSAIPVEPAPTPPTPTKIGKKPVPPPPIIGMKTDPVPLTFAFNAEALVSTGRTAAAEGVVVCRRLGQSAQRLKGERAALVLVFGGGPDVLRGQTVARAVANQLVCADPKLFAKATPFRAFWDGGLEYGAVRLEVFVFATKQPK